MSSMYPGRWFTEQQFHLPQGSFTLEVERDGKRLEERQLLVDGSEQRLELSFD